MVFTGCMYGFIPLCLDFAATKSYMGFCVLGVHDLETRKRHQRDSVPSASSLCTHSVPVGLVCILPCTSSNFNRKVIPLDQRTSHAQVVCVDCNSRSL